MVSARRRCALVLLSLGVISGDAQADTSVREEGGARVVTIRDLVALRDLDGLSASPDGSLVAFQVRQANPDLNSYALAWYVVSTEHGPARRIAEGGDPIQPARLGRTNGFVTAPPPVWSHDSTWIAYLRRDDGHTQIWRVHRDGRRATQLTHNEGDVRSFAYSRDGHRILFQTEPSRAQIEAALAAEGRNGFLYDRRFFPSYSRLPVLPRDAAFQGEQGSGEQAATRSIWVYDLRGSRERIATDAEREEFAALTTAPKPVERPAFREHAALSPGDVLAWTEARDSERQGGMAPLTIVVQNGAAGEPVVCAAAECTSQRIRDLWWRNDREIIFARTEGSLYHDTALYAWRPSDGALRLVLRTGDRLLGSRIEWRCAIARDRLVCFQEQVNHPRRLVAVDLDSGDVETLYDPNPEFARVGLGSSPQRVEIRTSSGIGAYGYLVLPPRQGPGERLPLVITTYRCSGFLRGGTGDEYPIYPFAAAGFAVFCFNVPDIDYQRLARMDWTVYAAWSRGAEGNPEKLRAQEALDAVVQRLDTMGVIDPDRIGLTGLSFGAETVTFALFNMPRLAAASASSFGYEPMDYYLYGQAARESLRVWGLGAPDATAARWRGFAVSPNAGRVRAPLLLNVTDHEMLSALQPVTALEDVGRAVEMYVFPDEHHIKSQPAHRLAIYERNIDWMNFWLRGVEDPAPAKAEQYVRWRAMRENQCRLFTGEDAPWYCEGEHKAAH